MGTMGAAFGASHAARASSPPAQSDWDAGRVRHLLPTVSDTRMLIKASFSRALDGPPVLTVGAIAVAGSPTDTEGKFWEFHASGLTPARRYPLALAGRDGASLCEPWELATFPSPDERPESCRVLFFTCAGGTGGPDGGRFLDPSIRNRLLRRALSFRPHAAVANGDHVYWDLHRPRVPPERRNNARLESFDRSALVFGHDNESTLKLAVEPQIVPVYGTDFRSTPVFFLQDDHDYFDNDEGMDEIVTLPPPWFSVQLARATQSLYYPAFLPDGNRPANLPWSSESLSESFGTLRYGRLAEVVLYDVRRTVTLAGPSAVFIDPEVEKWLDARTSSRDTTHLVHAPSNPPGWTAGKFGEWYPDVLDDDAVLTTAVPKPYWQAGWLGQHDRLMAALAAARDRVPLVVSGDLHAIAIGRMLRAGALDLRDNPITTVLSGPIGTGPGGWPSAFRKVGASPPAHLGMDEDVKPLEQHGFTLADFLPDRIVLRLFKWDVNSQPPEVIDDLEPFHTVELGR